MKNLSLNTAEAVDNVIVGTLLKQNPTKKCLNTAEAVDNVITVANDKFNRVFSLNTAEAVDNVIIPQKSTCRT